MIKFGEGFYPDGSDWHWMGTGGQLGISSEGQPAEVSFQLTCGIARHYSAFPFEVRIYRENVLADRRSFQVDNHAHSVSLNLAESDSETELRLESSASFIPRLCGLGSDSRELSVRLSHLRLEPRAPVRRCPICKDENQEENRLLGSLETNCEHASHLGPRSYQLVQCSECELIYLSPLPSQEVFDELYVNQTQFGCSEYSGLRGLWILCSFYCRTMRWLSRMISDSAHGLRVLEVGSGLSWMCRAAKLMNRKSTTVAQDISPEKMGSCPWVDHYVVGELHLKKKEIHEFAPYHVISLTHVIEHLPDPIDTLRICRSFLGETGVLFVTAPYRPRGWRDSSLLAVWRNWNYNHVPAHLQYFNESSMRQCARLSGLDLLFFSASAKKEGLKALLCRPERQLLRRP
jgi:Methyltransferase domain